MTNADSIPQRSETSPLLATAPIASRSLHSYDLNHNYSNVDDGSDTNIQYDSINTAIPTKNGCHLDTNFQSLRRDTLCHYTYKKYHNIVSSGNIKRFYPFVIILFITAVMIASTIAQHGADIMADDPTKTMTISLLKKKSKHHHKHSSKHYQNFPDTNTLYEYITNQQQINVKKYLDFPCLQAELYYDQHHISNDDHDENGNKDEVKEKEFSNGTTTTADETNNERQIEQKQQHSLVPPPKRCSTNCESTISLIRHCEKDVAREHCSYVGYERSLYLSTLFGNLTTDRWPIPSYIFALSPGERRLKNVRNWREVETVMPLSHVNNMTVDYSFGLDEREGLVEHILGLLRSGVLCGKSVIICWKHSDLANLAQSLGCGHENGCPKKWYGRDFDSLWEIKYAYRKLLNSPLAAEGVTEKKKKKKKKKDNEDNGKSHYDKPQWDKYPIWHVAGSEQQQGFDPLEFSKRMGDYQAEERDSGSWLEKIDNPTNSSSNL